MGMRMFLLAALLTLGASATSAQVKSGRGLYSTSPPEALALPNLPQYITQVYDWQSVPGTSAGNGWMQIQSTSGGVTVGANCPFLELLANTEDRRVTVWERGASAPFAGSYWNVNMKDGYEARVQIFGLDLVGSSDTGWFQLTIGDSTNFKVNKKPAQPSGYAFGILVTGSTNANNAYAPANQIVVFWASQNDTTYIPLPGPPPTTTRFIFKVRPLNGSVSEVQVSMWAEDDPTNTWTIWNDLPTWNTLGSDMSFTLNGATGLGPIAIGPVTVQRSWSTF